MCHVVVAACGYRIEEKEIPSLPGNLREILKEGTTVSTADGQFKALDLLSWMVGVHLSNTNRCVYVCYDLDTNLLVCISGKGR